MPCSLVHDQMLFEEICCLYLQGWWILVSAVSIFHLSWWQKSQVPLKRRLYQIQGRTAVITKFSPSSSSFFNQWASTLRNQKISLTFTNRNWRSGATANTSWSPLFHPPINMSCYFCINMFSKCPLYRVILSALDPRKCEYLKDYSLDFEHAYMTTYLASWEACRY